MPKLIYDKRVIEEVPVEGKRLGRHINHDPQSRNFPITQFLDESKQPKTKHWKRSVPVLDQGNLGSCTGNACTGLVGSTGFAHAIGKKIADGETIHVKTLNEDFAVKLYSLATQLDEFPGGAYPPNDTGSSTLGVLKAAQQLGLIQAYYWGFGMHDAMLSVSQIGPVIVGTNWYEGMDNPDGNGFLNIQGQVRGGHEYELVGIDIDQQAFVMENSWGDSWGNKGRALISWHDMDRLLGEDGEVGIGQV